MEMRIKPPISIIVAAMAPELGIGANGKLPWRLRKEIQYFRDVTTACNEGFTNAVIMGRKTWESIPSKSRPLPNRLNIVLSRSFANEVQDGVYHYNSLDLILDTLQKANYQVEQKTVSKIFIIGGAQIYNTFVNDARVDNLLVTDVHYTGDTDSTPKLDCFLNWDLSKWKKLNHKRLMEVTEIEVEPGLINEGDYAFEYTLWERK